MLYARARRRIRRSNFKVLDMVCWYRSLQLKTQHRDVISRRSALHFSYCTVYRDGNQRRLLLLDITTSLVRGRAQVYSRDFGIVQQEDATADDDSKKYVSTRQSVLL